MHTLDNSPISKPAIGRLVTEEQPVWQLSDNCLYVLPSNINIDENSLAECLDALLTNNDDGFVIEYNYEVLDDLPVFDKHQNLKKAIADEQANFILPISTPYQSQIQYLVFHSDNGNLKSNLELAFSTVRQMSNYSFREAIEDYAKNNVDEFCNTTKRTIDAGIVIKDAIKNFLAPSLGLLPSSPLRGVLLGVGKIVSFRTKKQLFEKLEENLQKYKKNKDPQAEAELSVVFNSIDLDTLLSIYANMTTKQIEKIIQNIDPAIIAKQSSLKLKISIVDKKLRKGNDGIFRLYFEKNNKSEHVHFERSETFVLYLMYLIDKYNNDDVDTFDVKNYKDQFVKLFNKNYGGMMGEVSYEKLTVVKKELGKKSPKQPKPLLLCHSDICQIISSVCNKLGESPLPYIIRTPQDHLFVLKSNILIPQEVLDLAK